MRKCGLRLFLVPYSVGTCNNLHAKSGNPCALEEEDAQHLSLIFCMFEATSKLFLYPILFFSSAHHCILCIFCCSMVIGCTMIQRVIQVFITQSLRKAIEGRWRSAIVRNFFHNFLRSPAIFSNSFTIL